MATGMSRRVLITRTFTGEWAAPLGEAFATVQIGRDGRALTREELLHDIAGADLLICGVSDRVDSAVLAAAPRLRGVVTYSVGFDHIDLDGCARRGIAVAHTPGVLTEATADLAWALLMGCARRVKPAQRWLEGNPGAPFDPLRFLGMELHGAVLGIVGLGKIGSAMARRASGFGMKVMVFHPRRSTGLYECVPFPELLERADVVSLHCPLTPDTHHLIGRAELERMKRGAILINTARGPVVDEAALVAHLSRHPDFFAGLDVFEREPRLSEGLLALANAMCLPHIGSATEATRRRMAEICVGEAKRIARGEPLQFPVKTPKCQEEETCPRTP